MQVVFEMVMQAQMRLHAELIGLQVVGKQGLQVGSAAQRWGAVHRRLKWTQCARPAWGKGGEGDVSAG